MLATLLRASDALMKNTGLALEASGFGPVPTPSETLLTLPGMTLRRYLPEGSASRGTVLIFPSPIKRAYLWDLVPAVSVVQRLLASGRRVALIDWHHPDALTDEFGLDDHAHRLPLAALEALGDAGPLTVTGHSLGGTLAALFAARHPDRVDKLLTFDAPLRFGPASSPLGAIVSVMPPAHVLRLAVGSPIPATYIDQALSVSSPLNQGGERIQDRMLVAASAMASPLHWLLNMRLERWFMDGLPLPGRLFEQVMEALYRQDAPGDGTLQLAGREVALSDLRADTLMVASPTSQVVPFGSLAKTLRSLPNARVLPWGPEPGTASSHVSALAGPLAHVLLWPRILAWLDAPDTPAGTQSADSSASQPEGVPA